jgi:hypothetical protein
MKYSQHLTVTRLSTYCLLFEIPMKFTFSILSLFACFSSLFAQTDSTSVSGDYLDSLYIQEVEDKYEPDKVLHAEPLYIDLIRDLGARKGEKEWNIGLGLTDNNRYDSYTALVEYEFAPVNRLGFEVELPFTFYYQPAGNGNTDSVPGNKLNSLKLATQYSFFVSEKLKTSMAIGYIHEFELNEFKNYGKKKFIQGNVYNPFFVAAKRWGNNFHTLLYTGPVIEHHFENNHFNHHWQINSNFHYMIEGTRNFIGVELNKEASQANFDMTIRPQMRVGIADNLLVGIVTGIPTNRSNERFSTFLRLIYEPGHKHKKS